MGIKIASRKPFLVEINMGSRILTEAMRIKTGQQSFLKQRLQLKTVKSRSAAVFIGTIHTVVWMNQLEDDDLEKLGEEISQPSSLTEKTNVILFRY